MPITASPRPLLMSFLLVIMLAHNLNSPDQQTTNISVSVVVCTPADEQFIRS